MEWFIPIPLLPAKAGKSNEPAVLTPTVEPKVAMDRAKKWIERGTAEPVGAKSAYVADLSEPNVHQSNGFNLSLKGNELKRAMVLIEILGAPKARKHR